MLTIKQFDHIVLSVSSDQITLKDIETLADAVHAIRQQQSEVYLLAIPVDVTGYPSTVSDVIKAARLMRTSTGQVTRLYGIQYSKALSFISKVVIRMLQLESNTVESATLDELFEAIEYDTDLYPNLKRSWQAHKATIKAELGVTESASGTDDLKA